MHKTVAAMLAISILSLGSISSNASEPKIEAFKAPFHVGKTVMACGSLAQVKHVSNRHYLNMDKKYPAQSLTVLVWDSDYRWFEERFGSIDGFVGRRFCVRGKIEEYKNNMQMQVTNPQFLRLMNQ